MNRYAISFTIRPGTEAEVAEVLRGYRRPPAGAAGGPPLLRRTTVFMAGQRVVRVIDVDGEIGMVLGHLAGRPEIRAVEAALDPFLAVPRDLATPEGVRAFLHQALLPATPDPAPPAPGAPAAPVGQRCGLLLPVRAGAGEAAARLLTEVATGAARVNGHAPLALTSFRRGDVLVAMLETDAATATGGSAAEARDLLARAGCRAPAVAALAKALATDADLATPAGFRAFLDTCQMAMVTDRRVGVPA